MSRKHTRRVALIRMRAHTHTTRTKDELTLTRDTGTTLIMLLAQHHHRAPELHTLCISIKGIG